MQDFNSYGYVDSKYDYLKKPVSGNYFRGEYTIYMNLYSFAPPIRAAIKAGKAGTVPGWGPTTHELINTFDSIKWVKDNGMDYVDPAFYFVPGYDDFAMPTEKEKIQIKNRVLELKKYADDIGIKIISTGIRNDFCTSDSERIKRDIERAKFYLEMSDLLDAKMMRLFVGEIPDDIEKTGFEKVADERFVKSIRELAEYCSSKNIKCMVAYQNHGDFLSTGNQSLYVADKLKDLPNTGLINDTGHFRHFGSKRADNYPWYDDIAKCLPVTVAFQLKMKPAGTESSGPLMDLPLFFRRLRMSECRCPISFEMLWRESNEDDPRKSANPVEEYKKQSLLFFKEIKAAELASRNMEPLK